MTGMWFYLDDEDDEDEIYEKDEPIDDPIDLFEEEDLDLFEYKCKNCGSVMVEDGYCDVCGWFAGV